MGWLRGLLELSGWGGLSAAEQATAIYGGAAGLATVLLGRTLFGGGRRR